MNDILQEDRLFAKLACFVWMPNTRLLQCMMRKYATQIYYDPVSKMALGILQEAPAD